MEILVIIPSTDLTGPIKGSYAICNLLSNYCQITLICLKKTKSFAKFLDRRIKVINLEKKTFLTKYPF